MAVTPNGLGWDEGNGRVRTMWLDGQGVYVEEFDILPCPRCGSTDHEVFANVISCLDCGFDGKFQSGPEFLCDWREAIIDWNNDLLRALTEPWKMTTSFVPPTPRESAKETR